MRDKITDPFLNSDGTTVEIWEGKSNFISHFILQVIKVNLCQYNGRSTEYHWIDARIIDLCILSNNLLDRRRSIVGPRITCIPGEGGLLWLYACVKFRSYWVKLRHMWLPYWMRQVAWHPLFGGYHGMQSSLVSIEHLQISSAIPDRQMSCSNLA